MKYRKISYVVLLIIGFSILSLLSDFITDDVKRLWWSLKTNFLWILFIAFKIYDVKSE